MIDDPVSLLEERLKSLEMKVFRQTESDEELMVPIVDSLLESNKIVSAALSGRDRISTAVKSLDRLEEVLDPMYEDSVMDSAAKLAFIFSMENKLEEMTRLLVSVQELSPSLETDALRSLPQLMRQLDVLAVTTAEHQPLFNESDERIDDLIVRYTEVINGVTALFTTLDSLVTDLEIQAMPKPISED